MKLFNIRKVMVLVSVCIQEARISRTFFGGLKASRRRRLKQNDYFGKYKVKRTESSKGFDVTKFGGFRFFHLAHLSVVFTESRY